MPKPNTVNADYKIKNRSFKIQRPIIIVSTNYEIVNGLSGMQRDVILRLCVQLWNKLDVIKAIFGVCGTYQVWKKHSYFSKRIPINLPIVFGSNPDTSITYSASKIKFSQVYRSAYLDQDLSSVGIYLLEVVVTPGSFEVGLFLKSRLADHCFHFPNMRISKGTCCLTDDGMELDTVVVASFFTWEWNQEKPSTVRLELSRSRDVVTQAQTSILYFFVNNVQVPHKVTHIPSDAVFAVSSFLRPVVADIRLFQKIPHTTTNLRLLCESHAWRSEEEI